MARQKGIVKIEGTMDDITFFKTQDGFMVKQKSEIPKDRIMTDKSFERTRENMSEFARAGKGAKLLRSSVEDILVDCKDNRISSRLSQKMMQVLKSDPVSARGLRVVGNGSFAVLKAFDFNIDAPFTQTIKAPIVYTMDRPSGKMNIDIAPFIPANMVQQPQGTTHFRFISAAAEINFELETMTNSFFEGASLPINNLPTAALSILHNLAAASTNPLFLFLGIKFHQEVNGVEYALKNTSFNAFQLLNIDKP